MADKRIQLPSPADLAEVRGQPFFPVPGEVRIEERPVGRTPELVLVDVHFPAMDRPCAEALKKLAQQLPVLLLTSRQENFEARARAILQAFAPPDPLADEQLRITQSDAAARSEFFERVPVLDSKQIALAAGHSAQNPAQTAWRWRTARKIFSVPHGGTDYYPAFQFVDGQPLPLIAEILKRFATDPKRTAWQNALWFASENAWLGGAPPLDLLQSAPDRVLDAADNEMASRDY